jgi:hypothetical protein
MSKTISQSKSTNNIYLALFAILWSTLGICNIISGYFRFGVDDGMPKWRYWYYFTEQSNTFCLTWMLLFGITTFLSEKTRRNKVLGFLYKISHDIHAPFICAIFMLLVYIVVAGLLEPVYTGEFETFVSTSGALNHNFTPIVVVFIFFAGKWDGTIALKFFPWVMLYPILYAGTGFIIGANVDFPDGSHAYPYKFLDPTESPLSVVLTKVAVLVILFAIVSPLVILGKHAFDKKRLD